MILVVFCRWNPLKLLYLIHMKFLVIMQQFARFAFKDSYREINR
jgi:hypothetical protein